MKNTSVFVAAPISGFSSSYEYYKYRENVLSLIQYLRDRSLSVYSEVERVTGKGDYDSPDDSVLQDFERIKEADVFVMLHPIRAQTSALIELGYACALDKYIIIVGPKVALPYLALGLPSVFSFVRIIDTEAFNDKSCQQISSILANIVKAN